MSLTTLTTNLQTLQQTLSSLRTLIDRLSTLSPDDPSQNTTASPLHTELLSLSTDDPTPDPTELRADLTSEIQETIRFAEESSLLLSQDVHDALGPDPSTSGSRRSAAAGRRNHAENEEEMRLRSESYKLSEEVKRLHSLFRRAQVLVMKRWEVAARQERAAYLNGLRTARIAPDVDEYNAKVKGTSSPDEDDARATLLSKRRMGTQQQDSKPGLSTNDDLMITQSSSVTNALERLHNTMTSSLSQSRFAQEALEESNAALGELNEKYTGLGDVLAKSRGLLGTLLRSQKSDTWFLETAMWILIGVIVWELMRRLVLGPLWLVVIFPLKSVFSILSWFVGAGWSAGAAVASGSASTSLKIMPSASNRPTPLPESLRGKGIHIPVGAGGAGAKEVPRSIPGSLSESVGSRAETAMAARSTVGVSESNGQGDDGQGSSEGQAGDAQRRGDGSELPKRDESRQPRNPKKRMFEADVPPEGGDGDKDKGKKGAKNEL